MGVRLIAYIDNILVLAESKELAREGLVYRTDGELGITKYASFRSTFASLSSGLRRSLNVWIPPNLLPEQSCSGLSSLLLVSDHRPFWN